MVQRLRLTLVALLLGATAACGDGKAAKDDPSPTPTEAGPGVPVVEGTAATGLRVPWGLAFLPDGSAIVTERDTRRVLRVTAGEPVQTLGTIDDAAPNGEAGLLGVAVSPHYADDHQVFLYYTTDRDNRVVRTTVEGGRLGSSDVILDDIPAGAVHDGGRMAFGPDGHLYVATGETGVPELAQDSNSLAGKVLRITTSGKPAPGNPIPGSPVFSMGHRNVQGLAFDDADRLWASEFGWHTADELNLIEAERNYGWPQVEGMGGPAGMTEPHVTWPVDKASPSGLAFAHGKLWMASLRGERLWRIDIEDGRAVGPEDFFVRGYGRLRSIALAPDGRLWVTTSNHDGRGDPAKSDDRILIVRVPTT